VAGHMGLELRNVVANYPFESSRRFSGSQPNLDHRDHSRLSCGVRADRIRHLVSSRAIVAIVPTTDMASLSASVLDLGLDEHSEVIERLLPAEITGLDRDGRRQALLDDIDFGADRHRPQGDGSDHLAEQIRILEAIRVAD
jgi:hypothetical protein